MKQESEFLVLFLNSATSSFYREGAEAQRGGDMTKVTQLQRGSRQSQDSSLCVLDPQQNGGPCWERDKCFRLQGLRHILGGVHLAGEVWELGCDWDRMRLFLKVGFKYAARGAGDLAQRPKHVPCKCTVVGSIPDTGKKIK